ncbi:hypothetical protein GCM10027405_30280 [Arthrobacter alkaliphilus]
MKELASWSGRTVEYRSGARICRESWLWRLAKEGPGSSLTQPKRNDAVVVNKSDAKRPAGQCPGTTQSAKYRVQVIFRSKLGGYVP